MGTFLLYCILNCTFFKFSLEVLFYTIPYLPPHPRPRPPPLPVCVYVEQKSRFQSNPIITESEPADQPFLNGPMAPKVVLRRKSVDGQASTEIKNSKDGFKSIDEESVDENDEESVEDSGEEPEDEDPDFFSSGDDLDEGQRQRQERSLW